MRRGATLLELLVCVGILAVLFGLLLPALGRMREESGRVSCVHNLHQLALAVHSYNEANNHLPPYATESPYGGWWSQLMPYAGNQNVYRQFVDASASTPNGAGYVGGLGVWQDGVRNASFPLLHCPSDPSRGQQGADEFQWSMTNYLMNWYVAGDGVWGCFAPAQRTAKIADGLSNTVLLAEGYASCNGLPRRACLSCDYHNFGITETGKPSDDPTNLPDDYTMFQVQPAIAGNANVCDGQRAQTPHTALNVAFADGSARAIAAAISPAIWKNLVKPADGGAFDW